MTITVGLMLVVFTLGYTALRRGWPEPTWREPLTRLRTPAAAPETIMPGGVLLGPLDDAQLLEIEARFRLTAAADWARRLYVLPPGVTFSLVVHTGER